MQFTAQDLEERDWKVYRAITTYAPEDPVAWPSEASIARDTGLSRRTVQRAKANLRKAGLLSWTRRWAYTDSHRHPWQHCVYQLHEPYEATPLAIERTTSDFLEASRRWRPGSP